jgi:hypothetical protein
MAEGIVEATQFYSRYGISKQRLQALGQDPDLSLQQRWSMMLHIYLTTQLQVISGMGYPDNEVGLQTVRPCI